jgi:hypothetical protein
LKRFREQRISESNHVSAIAACSGTPRKLKVNDAVGSVADALRQGVLLRERRARHSRGCGHERYREGGT